MAICTKLGAFFSINPKYVQRSKLKFTKIKDVGEKNLTKVVKFL